MTNFGSRIIVALIGLPLVLGVVWLGGWWLCIMAALVGLLALHEYYGMTRPLRPIVIAGYLGLVLTVIAAQAGGAAWVVGALFATVALAFLLKGFADTKQSATVSVGGTTLGVIWIGLGLVALMACGDFPCTGDSLRSPCCWPCGPATPSRTWPGGCSGATSWRRRSPRARRGRGSSAERWPSCS
jgi:CDP-diglyceride synthetase